MNALIAARRATPLRQLCCHARFKPVLFFCLGKLCCQTRKRLSSRLSHLFSRILPSSCDLRHFWSKVCCTTWFCQHFIFVFLSFFLSSDFFFWVTFPKRGFYTQILANRDSNSFRCIKNFKYLNVETIRKWTNHFVWIVLEECSLDRMNITKIFEYDWKIYSTSVFSFLLCD